MKKFNNIENFCITDTKGTEHWISPSISTDALVVVISKVLIVKRGTSMSNPNKWCLPCGFMDFNESPLGICIRELYEETGIDVQETDIWNSDYDRPFCLNGTALQFKFELREFPVVKLDGIECIDYKWIGIDELQDYSFAFGHDRLIRLLL